MLFSSPIFLIFFSIVFVIAWAERNAARRKFWLLAASYIFYAAWDWRFLSLIALSTAVDFIAGRAIQSSEDSKRRRALLIASLVVNLGVLGFFKYFNFFVESASALLAPMGLTEADRALSIVLPVGISFYTFQSMSYTIDIYRGRVAPAQRFFDFAAFVSLFPQLIAGPIVRFSHLGPQLVNRVHELPRFSRGLFLFVVGMAKKILVADTLALLAAPLFAQEEPSFVSSWVSMFLFAGQIYFDFSGYSDMAIGLGNMLGFEFPWNFRSPYKAVSFSDFWRRWHISLSTWLRDYLYIPLGGNRRSVPRTYINLFATMLIGGLWHGASWNFVLWGAAHGSFLGLERLAKGFGIPAPPLPIRRLLIFLGVTLAWVPFKFETFAQTTHWLGSMLGLGGSLGSIDIWQSAGLIAFFCLIWGFKNTAEWKIRLEPAQAAFGCLLFLFTLLVAYGRVEISPFLYFRF